MSEFSKYLSQTSQTPGCDLNVARPKDNFVLPPIEMRRFLSPFGCACSPRASSRISITETQQRLFGLLITAARGNVHTPALSSPVEAHESWRVNSTDAECFIFGSRVPVVGRDGWYLALRNEYRKVSSFS